MNVVLWMQSKRFYDYYLRSLEQIVQKWDNRRNLMQAYAQQSKYVIVQSRSLYSCKLDLRRLSTQGFLWICCLLALNPSSSVIPLNQTKFWRGSETIRTNLRKNSSCIISSQRTSSFQSLITPEKMKPTFGQAHSSKHSIW